MMEITAGDVNDVKRSWQQLATDKSILIDLLVGYVRKQENAESEKAYRDASINYLALRDILIDALKE